MTTTDSPPTGRGVFAEFEDAVWKNRFRVEFHLDTICGGIPSNPKVVEGWLRSKLDKGDAEIRAMVEEIMHERGMDVDGLKAEDAAKTPDEIIAAVAERKALVGFKLDDNGIYIEGRQLKAAIKEAANVHWPKARWGPSNKGTRAFFAEHLFVLEDKVYIRRAGENLHEPDETEQRFVHTWRGSAIQNVELCREVDIIFTLVTDHDFKREEWGELFVTGQKEGLGASRSQGWGVYTVTAFDPIGD